MIFVKSNANISHKKKLIFKLLNKITSQKLEAFGKLNNGKSHQRNTTISEI